MHPLEPHDIFLSYSLDDSEWVAGLVALLQDKGLRVLADPTKPEPEDEQETWHRATMSGLEHSRACLAVVSPAYLDCPGCQAEWDAAVRRTDTRQNGFLRQIQIAPTDVPAGFDRIAMTVAFDSDSGAATPTGDPSIATFVEELAAELAVKGPNKRVGKVRHVEEPPSREADPWPKDASGRNWRTLDRLLMPTGRSLRSAFRPNGLDDRRRAFYDDNWKNWNLFESGMAALAKSLSPDWYHGTSDVSWVRYYLNKLVDDGGFVEHLHLIGDPTADATGGFRLGGHRVHGYWDGYALGYLIANALSLPGTITVWAPASGQSHPELGRTISGIAASTGCLTAGIATRAFVIDKAHEDRWRVHDESGKGSGENRVMEASGADAIQGGNSSNFHWVIAYPDGTIERGDDRDQDDQRRRRPFGPLDADPKRSLSGR